MKKLLLIFIALLTPVVVCAQRNFNVAEYGLTPNSSINATPVVAKILEEIKQYGKSASLVFPKGTYQFAPDKNNQREYYISNHDQDNPKNVGIPIEGLKNLTVEGNGSDFLFSGRMIPLSIINGEGCTLKNFSVDFPKPHIAQAKIVKNDTVNGLIDIEVAPWVDFELRNGKLINKGEGWENPMTMCIAFEEKTKHLVYGTSDLNIGKCIEKLSDRIIRTQWADKRLIEGTVIAMRSWYRPTPGIFVYDSKNTLIENVTVHYCEGMGLIAQMSENISLQNFKVALRGENDPRYFTAQADATHFSGCRGKIISKGGLYEAMMDDAINIHGTYLNTTKRISSNVLQAQYMHGQSWGFRWGDVGDKVQFVTPKTMELVGSENRIKAIKAIDKPSAHGAKIFEIEFESTLPDPIAPGVGIENLTWTPQVLFADNMIRNNRARGALFSTPNKTIIEGNTFDHTSGTAILLCGDCNGWYETGACKEVVIRNNHFINALTSMFQFTNGVISIYPEIPDLVNQKKYFHGGRKDAILIENNIFEMFDKPLVYAKSVDGLTFRGNTIVTNNDYPAYHWIKVPFYFERAINWQIKDNKFDVPFDLSIDVIDK